MSDFKGFNPLIANFTQLPNEIFEDSELDLSELTTLVFLNSLIAWEQFRRGVGRLAAVPLPWPVIARRLRLSEDAAKTRVAVLEDLGRIQVFEGPKQLVKGALLDGPNLFVLRWNDQPKTARLEARVKRRTKEAARLRALKEASKSPESSGVRPRTPDEQGNRDASTHPSPRTPDPASNTPASDAPPSNKSTETDTDKELTNSQSVSQESSSSNGSRGEETDGRTDGLPESLLNSIGEILDPPQVAKIAAESPWSAAEAWQILESIRVHGAKLQKPAAVTYNALLIQEKGTLWLSRVRGLFAAAGWQEEAEDGTHLEAPERKKSGAVLAAAGFRRFTASPEALAKRAEIQAQAPKPQPKPVPVLAKCSDEEANRIWNRMKVSLRESLPSSTFTDWISPMEPVSFRNSVLTVMTISQTARLFIEQALAEEFFLASEDTIAELEIPSFTITVKAL